MRKLLLAATSAAALVVGAAPVAATVDTTEGTEGAAPSGDPIVVGSTLSLTGAFGATGVIHQIAGEQFVDRLNASGGLLGRPVEWLVLDDESDQAQVTTLYERLISQDQVDLIIGPYATPNILSAVAVAERHGYTIPQHTAVIAPLLSYDCQFPGWSIGPTPNEYVPTMLLDAVESLPEPPATIVVATNQSGSTDFITRGVPDDDSDAGMLSIAEERGYEVVDMPYPPGTTDWAPIATQIRDADPDLLVNNGLGVDPVGLIEAMLQLDYQPPMMFSLFPAPGPLLGLGELGRGVALGLDLRAQRGASRAVPAEAAEIVDRVPVTGARPRASRTRPSRPRPRRRGTPGTSSPKASRAPAASTSRRSATTSTRTVSTRRSAGISSSIRRSTTSGRASQGIKQIQDGDWVMVWPADRAAAELRASGGLSTTRPLRRRRALGSTAQRCGPRGRR